MPTWKLVNLFGVASLAMSMLRRECASDFFAIYGSALKMPFSSLTEDAKQPSTSLSTLYWIAVFFGFLFLCVQPHSNASLMTCWLQVRQCPTEMTHQAEGAVGALKELSFARKQLAPWHDLRPPSGRLSCEDS